MITHRPPLAVAQLVLELHNLKIALPEKVLGGARRLQRLHHDGPGGAGPTVRPGLLNLDDDGLVVAFRDLALTYAIRGESESSGPAARARSMLADAMAEELAVELRQRADEIIAVLRPTFEEAADVVHDATRAGMHEHTTDRDIVKADDVPAMAAAWRSIPDAVDALERIAAVRMDLTEVAGVPPELVGTQWTPAPTALQVAGSMFRPDSPRFRVEYEQPWQRWVRLSTGEPVRLLTVAESTAAWSRAAPRYSPLVDEHADELEEVAR
jgi:hypothetical protein